MCMETETRKPEQETADQGREAIEVAYLKHCHWQDKPRRLES